VRERRTHFSSEKIRKSVKLTPRTVSSFQVGVDVMPQKLCILISKYFIFILIINDRGIVETHLNRPRVVRFGERNSDFIKTRPT